MSLRRVVIGLLLTGGVLLVLGVDCAFDVALGSFALAFLCAGPALAEALRALSAEVTSVTVVPDERAEIAARIVEAADSKVVDVILVAGGTGLGP